jgi:hypothetical protein
MKKSILAVLVVGASISSAFADGIDFSGPTKFYGSGEFVSATPGVGVRLGLGAEIGTVALASGNKIKLSAEVAYSTVNIAVQTGIALGGTNQIAAVIAIPFDSKIDWIVRPVMSFDTGNTVTTMSNGASVNSMPHGNSVGFGFAYKINNSLSARAIVDGSSVLGSMGVIAVGATYTFN